MHKDDSAPSGSREVTAERGDSVFKILEVKKLGSVVLRATRNAAGLWDFNGVSIYDDTAIKFE